MAAISDSFSQRSPDSTISWIPVPYIPLAPPNTRKAAISRASFGLTPFSVSARSASTTLAATWFSYLSSLAAAAISTARLIRKRRDAAISRSCPDVCTTTSIRGRPNSADGISFKSLTRPKASRTGSTPSIYNTCAMVAPPVSMNSADQSV